jgi:hypothetical protein
MMNSWPEKYYVTKNHYLVYYKHADSNRVLGAIDITQSSHIGTLGGSDFELVMGGYGSYVLRAETPKEALAWVEDLRSRRTRSIAENERLAELMKKELEETVSSTSLIYTH